MALCCLSGSADAARLATTKDLVTVARGGNLQFRALITGAGRGLEVANADLENHGKAPLYCQPNIAITEDQYIRILEVFIEREPAYGRMESVMFGISMLAALRDAFPCK